MGDTGNGRLLDCEQRANLDQLELLTLLGTGSFGKVFLCRERATGTLHALKLLLKTEIVERKLASRTVAEYTVLKNTRHPFLLAMHNCVETPDYIGFLVEFANGGEMYSHLQHVRRFSEERSRFYAAEIVSALGYLHREGIVYRDLKLENLLLDKDGHIKVADFGLCKLNMRYGSCMMALCGTKEYLAPEVLKHNGYGPAVDWWAVGVVLYEMLCGTPPFRERKSCNVYKQIVSTEVVIPKEKSPTARSILAGLLTKDPGRRLGGGPSDAVEIMNHPFFAEINFQDLEDKMIPPPFRPILGSAVDTRYFESEFTSKSVELTPLPPKREHLSQLGDHFMVLSDSE